MENDEKRAERQFRKTMKEQGYTDEEIGIPFMDWLRQDSAQQKSQAMSRRDSQSSQIPNIRVGSPPAASSSPS